MAKKSRSKSRKGPKLKLGKIVPGKGDLILQDGDGNVVWHTARGKLILCDCSAWEWQCTDRPDGDTVCVKVCIAWGDCKEVPAVKTR